ncbi:MAG TPA: serine hydroxymethyltransferase [Noviherbaspirillum sp.]|nr:serine hydroxymethyltransferase [Noviherbaspirillum sp.]
MDMQWLQIDSLIHLIASASYPFPSVLQALSAPSFVFPAEGMPGSRYLPGSSVMDHVEIEGESLALRLMHAPSDYCATLQPHSGTQANQMVYHAVLKPQDRVVALNPKNGGHISHTVLIGRANKVHYFGLDQNSLPDYVQLEILANQVKPRLIIVGGSSLPRQIDFRRCGEIAQQCGAYLHGDISHTATFIAGKLHASPFPHCDFLTFNTVKNLRGPNGGVLMFRRDHKAVIAQAIFPTSQGGANETNMLGKFAVFSEWQTHDINAYAASIVAAAQIMGEELKSAGISLVTNGTDSHILLIDLRTTSQTGADVERRLEHIGVLVNRNLVPYDPRSPLETSGIRIGTANLAILNYEEADLKSLARLIANVILNRSTDTDITKKLLEKYNRATSWHGV